MLRARRSQPEAMDVMMHTSVPPVNAGLLGGATSPFVPARRPRGEARRAREGEAIAAFVVPPGPLSQINALHSGTVPTCPRGG
jgi:hypothetical protein